MIRVMYDGVTPAQVPMGATIYAGYVDGHYPSYSALVRQFPNTLHVSITTTAAGTARVLDVENGDATPEQAPGWAARMRQLGLAYPVVYMNASTWPGVKAQFLLQHVDAPLYWVAQYDQEPAIPAGAIAKQHTNLPGYDISSAAAYWPGLDPLPAHPEENDMTTTSVNGRAGLSWAAGTRHVVQVTYDPAAGDPDLRVVLALTTGPLVRTWTLPKGSGSGVFEIPPQIIPTCRGVILEGAPGVVYDAVAV